MRVEKEEFSVM